MALAKFYKKFLDALNANDVAYLVVGGHAVNFHGYTRATLDLDIWIDKTERNLRNLENVFIEMGYSEDRSKEAISYFTANHKINIPKDQSLIEILDATILKSDFEVAFKKKITGNIEETSFFVIDLQTLLEIKSGSNRLQDLNDAEKLRQINDARESSEPEEGYTLE